MEIISTLSENCRDNSEEESCEDEESERKGSATRAPFIEALKEISNDSQRSEKD